MHKRCLGKWTPQNKSYLEGLEVAIKNDNHAGIVGLYAELGNLRNTLGRTKEALAFHTQSLELANSENLSIPQARAKINIGEIYEAQGKYKESLQMFQEALSICVENRLGGYRSSIHENMGDVNLTIKEYETAEKNYKEALKDAERFHNTNREISLYKN